MPVRRRNQLVLACVALTAVGLIGITASRRDHRASGDQENPESLPTVRADDPRDQAATMPDPRGRSLYPEASCLAPARMLEGVAPRCVVSFGRVMTALGVGRAGTLAITSLAHAATVGWSLPAASATLLFSPLPADAEARAILVDESRRQALFAVGEELWRYDTSSGELVARTPGPGGMIEDLAWSDSGARPAVVAAAGGRASLLDGEGAVLRTLPTAGPALRVAMTASGERVAVATEHGDVAIFDLRTSAPPTMSAPSSQPAAGLAFARDDLVLAGSDGVLRTFASRSGREVAQVDVGSPLLQLAVSRDGRVVATAASDGAIRLYALPGLRSTAELVWHRARIGALAFGAGPTLVSADNDGELAVWDIDASGVPSRR